MIKKEKLISDCDGLELMLLETLPESSAPVKGIIQFSHGMAEHGSRYLPVMEFLSSHGYVCVIHDHRGHGSSVNDQEEWGYFYDSTGTYIVEDLHQVTLYMKKQYPQVPVILLGHSMGTLVSRCYLRRYDGEIQKLILSGAPCKNGAVDVGLFLTKIIGAVKGDRYRSRMLHNISIGLYAKKFAAEGFSAWICSDREQVEKYEKDEGCGFMFSINGYRNLFLLLKRTYMKKGWCVKQPGLPILFLGGEDDPVIGGRKKFQYMIDFLRGLGYRNITAKLYQGKRHEILNEDIREQVYEEILQWIETP